MYSQAEIDEGFLSACAYCEDAASVSLFVAAVRFEQKRRPYLRGWDQWDAFLAGEIRLWRLKEGLPS